MTPAPRADATPTPKVFVATPTANGLMLSDTVASVVRMVTRLHAAGIATDYRTVDGPNLVLQRDVLAHDFLASDATHLLFVDSDMAFGPDLCERLLAARKPLIGTIYTRRALDLAEVKRLAPSHGFDRALALAYDWNVRFLGPQLTVTDGLCRVEGIGLGFALIERGCLLAMAEGCPTYASPLGSGPLQSFFREMPVGDDGAVLGDDYAFCRRWNERGGEVWAFAAADIRHVGDFAYGVPFSAYLEALRAGAEPRSGEGLPPSPAARPHANGAAP